MMPWRAPKHKLKTFARESNPMKAQGAIVKPSAASARRSLGRTTIELASPTAGALVGQGATEYLVLLAVVLIVALVSVALLGFFPGMASDSQITQSQMYWKSATPIAITESAARYSQPWSGSSEDYFMFRNNGAYPVRITKLLGGSNASSLLFVCYDTNFCGSGSKNISDYYYLAPGEEKYLGGSGFGVSSRHHVLRPDSANHVDTNYQLLAASSVCQNSTASPGTVVIKNFGFEYIQYIDGQQITKRFVGSKPLIIKCREPNYIS